MTRILAIEDDVELCELLSEYLGSEGFYFSSVHSGKKGVEAALRGEHDIVVLDVMLPEMNGFDVLRSIRAESAIPVIMLTARGDDVDRIVGLEIGADDYVPKPFNPRELIARIKAVLRRYEGRVKNTASIVGEPILQVADIELDPRSHVVKREGEVVELTSLEFRLLETFLEKAGEVIKRQDLVRKVLERSYSPFDRSIDVHISNLRKKIGPGNDGTERIKTIRGEGYLYSCPSSPGDEKRDVRERTGQ